MSFEFKLSGHMAEIPSNPIFHLLPLLNEPGFVSFAAGVPSPETFPYQELARIAGELLTRDYKLLLQYGSTEGYPPARAALARHLGRYGLSAKPSEVIVTTGGQQGIDLLCKLFVQPGDAVLVESPTYSATLQILRSYRARCVPLRTDEDGAQPEDIEAKVKSEKPRLVYLNPTFQNPSGRTMGLARRKAAAEITGRLGVILVEDDPYRDLRYEGEHLPTIKSFDKEGNVVFLTSTSKILCPGLRVGAVHAREDLIPYLTVAKQAADMHSSTLPQAIVAEYLDRGLIGAHIDGLCAMYRERLRAMLARLDADFPKAVRHTSPQGGLFVWCELPQGFDATAALERAVERKVAYIPGDQFFAEPGARNYMRLNFSNEPVANIERGMGVLGGLLAGMLQGA
jgi:DNA-binding transcriptional MocR family regulator